MLISFVYQMTELLVPIDGTRRGGVVRLVRTVVEMMVVVVVVVLVVLVVVRVVAFELVTNKKLTKIA